MKPHEVRFVVETALSAPSVHNTQPWLFRAGPDWIDVLADRSRQLRAQDPLGRELLLSCGAAVTHAALAVRGLQRGCRVEMLPDGPQSWDEGGDQQRVARLHLGGDEPQTAIERGLLDAAGHRHTDRSAFAAGPLPDELVARLRSVTVGDGVQLLAETRPDAILEIEVLVAEADRVARSDTGLQHDVAQWVRTEERPAEGVPADALPDHGAGRGSSIVLRDFDPVPQTSWADDDPPVAEHPLLMILSTEGDGRADWLRAGAALGRLLLVATVEGLVANPQTQVLEQVAPRLRLRTWLGLSSWPQMLLRVGFPGESAGSPRTGRRSVDDVLLAGS